MRATDAASRRTVRGVSRISGVGKVSAATTAQSAPVSEANPRRRPWAELDDTGRRKVVDSYRLAYISEELVN